MNARVDQWLTNFAEDDRFAARLLFDGLDLVSEDQVRSGLNERIENLATVLPGPLVLLPVRELPIAEGYFDPSDNTIPPEAISPRGEHGSEAIVANIVTGQLRRKNMPFLKDPSIEAMREAKVRSILLVSDFAGSGDQIVKFERAINQHPSIASWRSRGWIRIHALTYAATNVAMERLRDHFGQRQVHSHKACRSFDDCGWSREERAAIEKLCVGYGPRRRRRSRSKFGPYGYKNSQGMMAFAYSVPNNLPAVLTTLGRAQGSRNWEPLFEGRVVPPELRPLFGDPSPEKRLHRSLKAARQERLAKGGWASVAGTDASRLLLLLAALSRRPKRVDQVMGMTGLAAMEIVQLARCLRSWGLLGENLHLTDAGRQELRHAKGLRLLDPPPLLHANTEPYYPRQLRVER
ncbi:MAG: phosphoribosyltransferase-like protein [Tsuneonella suprasediminis]